MLRTNSPPPHHTYYRSTTNTVDNPSTSTADEDDLLRKLHKEFRKTMKSRINTNDLFAYLSRKRADALKKAEAYQRMSEMLDDEIEYIIRRTGVTEVGTSIFK